MQRHLKAFASLLAASGIVALSAWSSTGRAVAQSRSQSWEIMTPEPGQKRVRTLSETLPQQITTDGDKPATPARRARGSSSPSPLPPVRSVVTPLGVAPRTIEQPRITRPVRDPGPAPGTYGTVVPPPSVPIRPGQTFQDRAIACSHSGGIGGVPAGQLSSYTASCAQQR
ncbi:MAG: hypothetical protein HXY30_11225 [Pseudorhodoplanes sp.]|nr:hypothetical protein [Pseudorhodoplanes sp.]